ncbi:Pyruvate kinase [Clostridiales bacterium CHKCI006]|uniref:Pyruvate kinase n=1 Tax=Candidatus Fimiplasma intestinipullorum TaxID=2840825 RepID=A0A9D1HMW3_9FIRM|nr:Pyruvate kinase [Clostridiales bacterium CHKCI006]HIU13338.1 pyruvate kinase [Candidatus Fimiplasma intestinipullorum]
MMKEVEKKTRIVCTIGPASEDEETLRKMVKAGMNVMRLNFSHGDYEEHGRRIETLRRVCEELHRPVAILLDTKGPEIRTHDFEGGQTEFKKGQVVRIASQEILGTSDRFSITYANLYQDVKPGGFILVNDGQIQLLVDHVEDTDIVCVCANDGVVKNKRGINVPGIALQLEYLSEKDKADLEFGCRQGVDFIAASFTRRPQDIIDIKRLLVENNHPQIRVIAKIENQEGVEKIDDILRVADGIMVARGDLGVEVPAEDVPIIQKNIIRKCNAAGKVVITATQMLESMQQNPRPTRAEVSDVANAIMDGSDAIMLSGESAAGKYPVEAVETMARIASKIEDGLDYQRFHSEAVATSHKDYSEAICMSVAQIAYEYNAAAIVAFTISGYTAMKMSRYKPECPIIAATTDETVMRKLALSWGVTPVLCRSVPSTEAMLNYAELLAKEFGVEEGETVIVTGGTPGAPGTTSFLNLITIK